MRCGFCGRDFTETEAVAGCAGCPLKKSCGHLRCPHCGYEAAKVPGWLGRLMGGRERIDETGTLAAAVPGGRAVIAKLDAADDRLVRRLMALGLVPGTEVSVLRNKPGVVVRVGRSELAIDRETAARIKVR